jgi:hypothetical protein
MMVYEWKGKARTHGLDAEDVGKHLDMIRRNNDGKLTTEQVVENAKPRNSLLHPVFEWDEVAAAGMWRKQQARDLIQSVYVTYKDEDPSMISAVRAFVSVHVEDEDAEPSFTHVGVALKDDRMRRELLNNALKELEGWRKKYEQYNELSAVFDAIDKARLDLGKQTVAT